MKRVTGARPTKANIARAEQSALTLSLTNERQTEVYRTKGVDSSEMALGLVRLIGGLFCALFCATSSFALGQTRYIELTPSPGSFRLVSNRAAAPIFAGAQDYPGV